MKYTAEHAFYAVMDVESKKFVKASEFVLVLPRMLIMEIP
jgi:hypothetical protein